MSATETVSDQLMTVPEVAGKTRLSRQTISAWCRAGRLDCIRLSKRSIRIARSSVERLIRAGMSRAHA